MSALRCRNTASSVKGAPSRRGATGSARPAARRRRQARPAPRQRRDVVARHQQPAAVAGDQVAGEGALVADDRASRDQRLDQAPGRLGRLVAEQKHLRRAQRLEHRRPGPSRSPASLPGRRTPARRTRACIAARSPAVAEPDRPEIHPARGQPLQHRPPSRTGPSSVRPADIGHAAAARARRRRFAASASGRDVVRRRDVRCRAPSRAAGRRVRRRRRSRGRGTARPSARRITARSSHAIGRWVSRARSRLSMARRRSRPPHDLRLHPVGPDRIGPPQPVRLEAGHRAPVAEQPADGERQIVSPADQPRGSPAGRPASAARNRSGR